MEAGEVQLLNFAYSLDVTITASLLKQMAVAFGRIISPAPLRYAILTYAALNRQDKIKGLHYKDKALRALRTRLNRKIVDSDVFAAQMLGWIACCQGSNKEALIHATGSRLMLSHLSGRETQAESSVALRLFKPLILDDMNYIVRICGESPRSVPSRGGSSFAQRLAYNQELCRTGTPSEAWQSPPLETVHNYLRGAIGCAIVLLKNIAIKEENGTSVLERNAEANQIIDYITAKIEDNVFKDTLASSKQSLPTAKTQLEAQLIQYQSVGLQCLKLMLAILEPSTILLGLESAQAITIAAQILSATKISGPSTLYYKDTYCCHLSLGAMVVPSADLFEGMKYPELSQY